ncbi:MAG: CbiX/SirB N-terminal domain-containing protein [Blastocatellia bacterium]|nr:CbiX/SirB N-terminal domain-containing protein [Blastocatellia bacterium]
MNRKSLRITIMLAAALFLSAVSDPALARRGETGEKKTGVLLLAHGGSQKWNDEVNKIAAQVNESMPVEVAFGMAAKRSIQDAIDRLIARGVRDIVAVPMFISSHSSIITATEYLLGLRASAPPELAIYARMSHDHGSHTASQPEDSSFDPTTPVKSTVPIRMTQALDNHPTVAAILLSRALGISQQPAREVVILVAHGPVSDKENDRWMAEMKSLAEQMKGGSGFKRIDYLTVRDDAPEPLRSRATAELRRVVERAIGEGNKVLIVPLLLSYGGIEEGVKKCLEGLSYVMSRQALLPDDRLAAWVLLSAEGAARNQ